MLITFNPNIGTKRKEPTQMCWFFSFSAGEDLFSRAVTRQVSSTLMSLTTVFGMGTGGSSSPLAPTILL